MRVNPVRRRRPRGRLIRPVLAAAVAAAALGAALVLLPDGGGAGPARETRAVPQPSPVAPQDRPAPAPHERSRRGGPRPLQDLSGLPRSRSLGLPHAGRLVDGVRLRRAGPTFATWDPIRKRAPNRHWRRWGSDRLVRLLLRISRAYAADHPAAPRLVIGDLSRPRGGDFGPRFGLPGHASHQNGLDADVYYPRRDGRLRAPDSIDQVDHRLSQDLVDRFVRAGAEKVFVGPSTGFTGPAGVVQVIPNHDNHLHVRIRPR
jgi:Penicillin-insensitive murein endopeptidase